MSPDGRLAARLRHCQSNIRQSNFGRATDHCLVCGFFLRDFLDLLEFAEATGAAGVQPAGGGVEHADDIDVAQPVGRGFVGKSFLEAEAAAFAGQIVAVDIAIAHDEIDRLVIEHIGGADIGAQDTAFRLADRPDFIFVITGRFLGGKGDAPGG